MQQTSMTIRQSKFTENIALASNNLLKIIDDILNLSKVEAGKIEFEQVEFKLEEVLSKLTQVTSPLIQKKHLEFKIEMDPRAPLRLIGDPLRLEQVLLNLAGNAIKFTETGEVAIGVALLERSDSYAKLKFSVRDSGIGISPAQRLKLFQPFVQADSTTARKHGGTGLGLAISRQFVKLMQGDMDVESEPGRGSTFSFTARFGAPANAMSAKSSALLPGVKLHALVIDRVTESQNQLANILNDLKFEVAAAMRVDDAPIEMAGNGIAEQKHFEVILVDGSEVGKDWLSDVIRIRERYGDRVTPAIILIADKSVGDQKMDCNALGLDDIIFKPMTRSSVYDSVMRVRSRRVGRKPCPIYSNRQSYSVLRGTRILLVEDEEINQQVAVGILGMAGCEVTIASSGAEALQKIDDDGSGKNRFDAVLMDLRMPGMDGIAATRQIRSEKRWNRLPIIAMTADAVQGIKGTCLAAGMNDYLSKPIVPDELFASLEQWITATRRSDRACAPGVIAREPDHG